jgi:hypothetical protein
VAKEAEKTETKESPQDAVERIKREQAEKAAAKAKAEGAELDPAKLESTGDNAELQKVAEDKLAKVLAEEDDSPMVGKTADPDNEERMSKANAAAENLKAIALSYQRSSPDSHVVFGFGGRKFTLGELRALFNL